MFIIDCLFFATVIVLLDNDTVLNIKKYSICIGDQWARGKPPRGLTQSVLLYTLLNTKGPLFDNQRGSKCCLCEQLGFSSICWMGHFWWTKTTKQFNFCMDPLGWMKAKKIFIIVIYPRNFKSQGGCITPIRWLKATALYRS